MSAPELAMPKYISLKNHPDISERWLQDRIVENPELLGLGGGLVARDIERSQPSGGRLDLLLEERGGDLIKWYEVEIQLGSLDESHIIRAIEYWDIERRRYPQYDHTAVIIAENITGRFLNVISLFNSAIPLIAIQLKGVEVNGAFTLVATRVLDVVQLGILEEPAGVTVSQDRSVWAQKLPPDTMKLVDDLIDLTNEVAPGCSPRFRKYYIGYGHDGRARNFIFFNPEKPEKPEKQSVRADFRLPKEDETDKLLDDAGLDVLTYYAKDGVYRIGIRRDDLKDEKRRDALSKLVRKASNA